MNRDEAAFGGDEHGQEPLESQYFVDPHWYQGAPLTAPPIDHHSLHTAPPFPHASAQLNPSTHQVRPPSPRFIPHRRAPPILPHNSPKHSIYGVPLDILPPPNNSRLEGFSSHRPEQADPPVLTGFSDEQKEALMRDPTLVELRRQQVADAEERKKDREFKARWRQEGGVSTETPRWGVQRIPLQVQGSPSGRSRPSPRR